MGNLRIKGTINLGLLTSVLSERTFDKVLPDIVVSFGGNIALAGMKSMLRAKKFKHWLIDENGDIIDTFKNLHTIFECKPIRFFDYFIKAASKNKNTLDYYNSWMKLHDNINIPVLPFSNVTVIKQFLKRIPENSLLHLSILNSIRISNFFDLPSSVKVYANIGCLGIDGSMSTFLGQAYVNQSLCFLIIGDLSFIYNMNALGICHIKNNVRVLLINNKAGGQFYTGTLPESIDLHIGAKHNINSRGWVESLGFIYLSADTEDEFLSKLEKFIGSGSDVPMVFEVFTDVRKDAAAITTVIDENGNNINKNIFDDTKKIVKTLIPKEAYNTLKTVIKDMRKK
jgi:2-succinyl-5-enolpyruvyl-6-hydroxy-3-cyclohexene-1-carboxylate synthase